MIAQVAEPKKLTEKQKREQHMLQFASQLQNWVPNGLYLYTYNRCIYCGEEGDTIDHVFPICFLTNLDRVGSMRARGVTVDSCRECNCKILGSRIFFSFQERLDAARHGIARRHRKLLEMPHWEDCEVRQLSGVLQLHVRKRSKAREIIIQRAEWQESPEFFDNLRMLREQVEAECPENEQVRRFFGCDAWNN
jgi:hypothetical protein